MKAQKYTVLHIRQRVVSQNQRGYVLRQLACEISGCWWQANYQGRTLANYRRPRHDELSFWWGWNWHPFEQVEGILATCKDLRGTLGARGHFWRDGHPSTDWVLWWLCSCRHELWPRAHSCILCQRGSLETKKCAVVKVLGLCDRRRAVDKRDDTSNPTEGGMVLEPCLLRFFPKGRSLGPAVDWEGLGIGRETTHQKKSPFPVLGVAWRLVFSQEALALQPKNPLERGKCLSLMHGKGNQRTMGWALLESG